RAARSAPRRAAADRAARRPARHPSPRDRPPPARLPSREADRTMTAPSPTRRLAVLGAGSWGTTFARVLADGGSEVVLWARREEIAREIREEHRNRAYLPQHDLPETVHGTSDLDEALAGADGVVVAVPAQSLRATLQARPALPAVPVLSLTKGIERGTDSRISQVIVEAGRAQPELVEIGRASCREGEGDSGGG